MKIAFSKIYSMHNFKIICPSGLINILAFHVTLKLVNFIHIVFHDTILKVNSNPGGQPLTIPHNASNSDLRFYHSAQGTRTKFNKSISSIVQTNTKKFSFHENGYNIREKTGKS